MKKIGFGVIFMVVLFSSCQKDKLVGDAGLLIGKWNWTASYLVPNHCEVDSNWIYRLQDTVAEGLTYALDYEEKGKLIFSHNDGEIWNKRIVFLEQVPIEDPSFSHRFTIILNNQIDDKMELLVGKDTLMCYDFPKDTDEECEEMLNYFEKT